MPELLSIFFNVIMPVFGIVLLGFLLGKPLQLQSGTLTRIAYYVFAPAFIFQAIGRADIPLNIAARMIGFIVLAHLLSVVIAGAIGRVLRRSKPMIAAFIMIASFGNIGNYGLAIIRFRLGDQAVIPATIYFVAITTVAFIVCVGAAGWVRGGSLGAVWGVLKTPALWALPPALLVSVYDVQIPLMLNRMIELLATAMIPVMLFALGLQLLEQRKVMLSTDVWLASGIRLLLVPLVAYLVSIPFGFGRIDQTVGILQAGMPTAILVAIISKENDVVPHFVTSVVVVSTLLSLFTLTLLMLWI